MTMNKIRAQTQAHEKKTCSYTFTWKQVPDKTVEFDKHFNSIFNLRLSRILIHSACVLFSVKFHYPFLISSLSCFSGFRCIFYFALLRALYYTKMSISQCFVSASKQKPATTTSKKLGQFNFAVGGFPSAIHVQCFVGTYLLQFLK